MPLADYIAEVMQVLEDPNWSGDEILVQRAKTLRFAGKNDYGRIFQANNNR
jgi:short-subunit dehydrogenase involved in D-alanine esterification of teichoic acids